MEEFEEGFIEAVEEAKQGESVAAASGAHQRLLNSIKDIEEAGVNEAALEERFSYYASGGEGEQIATEYIPSQGLQPSLNDPKMWMVKTKPGKEKEAIIHLMNRFFLKQELGQSLEIMSVIAPENTKGFIFVEAEKEPHVRAAIHNIPNIFSFHTTLVPMHQMTSVLRVSNQAADLKPGDWVRIKRGKYVGDLAQVASVDQGGQKVEVKIVPRINFEEQTETAALEKDKDKDKEKEGEDGVKGENGEKVLSKYLSMNLYMNLYLSI